MGSLGQKLKVVRKAQAPGWRLGETGRSNEKLPKVQAIWNLRERGQGTTSAVSISMGLGWW